MLNFGPQWQGRKNHFRRFFHVYIFCRLGISNPLAHAKKADNFSIFVHNGRAGKITFVCFEMCIFFSCHGLSSPLAHTKNTGNSGTFVHDGRAGKITFIFFEHLQKNTLSAPRFPLSRYKTFPSPSPRAVQEGPHLCARVGPGISLAPVSCRHSPSPRAAMEKKHLVGPEISIITV